MELWTEYEGRTIDGAFPLAKLLQPEGRSAFFSTPNGSGMPTVIRLIESHFDDDEILARWRGVAALNHPNLVKLKKFGKVEMDGAPLVYAVMETADGNLGEIVAERKLSLDETREVALSLTAALGVLHENGFVHEHVTPGSVLAVGDAIKLRSDCIREAPEGEEGAELKQRDVHDLALVLLRALTQKKALEDAAAEMPLAVPFDEIVRKGFSGEWGLAEIEAALASGASQQMVVPVKSAPRAANQVEDVEKSVAAAPMVRTRLRGDADETSNGMGLKLVLGLSVLVLGLIVWHMFHSRPTEQSIAVPAVASEAAPAAAPVAVPVVTKPLAATGSSAVPVSAESQSVSPHVEWRVIAFTYNHEDQAKTKAERVAGRHPELSPQVFTPNGRAPYLVSIGGAMGRKDAYALAQKERDAGLASDVYAQNFRVAGSAMQR